MPIQLLGTTFIYAERDEQEVTHIDETFFPHTSDTGNDSGSHADLASINLDPASNRMVDDLVGSGAVENDSDEPLQPQTASGTSSGFGNETSYGRFGTATARELAARVETQDQAQIRVQPLLPSIYNSPFALQPGEAASHSRPSTAKRPKSSHSPPTSQMSCPIQQPGAYRIESSQSSMPEPTNPNPPMYDAYPRKPYIDQVLRNTAGHHTSARSSLVYGGENFSTLDACHFIGPTVDFGCSDMEAGVTMVQTTPNGQGAG